MSVHESNLNKTNSENGEQHKNEVDVKESVPKGRWNQLYIKSKSKKVKEDNLRKQAIAKRELEMLNECTFQPQITKAPKYLKYNNGLLTFQNENNTPLLEQRTKAWLIKKEDKLNNLKNFENNKSLNECCFKPQIVIHLYNIFIYRIQKQII